MVVRLPESFPLDGGSAATCFIAMATVWVSFVPDESLGFIANQ